MTDPTYAAIGAAFVDEPSGRRGITLLPAESGVAFLVLSDDDWLRIGRAVAEWFPPGDGAHRAAADAALDELRRMRDAGGFNADEEIIVARMERLAASRPRPEEPC